jgi:N-acyl-D-aspartate/D-glutamate deacylase
VPYDIVVRGGTVVDGTGAPRRRGDVAIAAGRVVEIGDVAERGRAEIDAGGLFVTPGFVDGHTHLDAQICWDPLGPSAPHGVTSVVAGNCGIGVAPCHDAEEREVFIMPALAIAEDIHRPTIETAVDWSWTTFPEYLAVVDARPKGINFGACVGHGALRSYVLGDRAYDEGGATSDEIAAMSRELDASLRAGALGFTSMLPGSSLFAYYGDADVRDMDPRVVCGLANADEIDALADVLGAFGRGGIQLGGGRWDDIVALSLRTGLPVQLVFGNGPPDPDFTLREFDDAQARGANLLAGISARPQTSVVGFRARLPFDGLPEWSELRRRPLDEQRAALLDPPRRSRLFEIARHGPYPLVHGLAARQPDWSKMSILDRPVPPFTTVADRASAHGRDPLEVFVDLSIESDFHQLFAQPATHDHDRATWIERLRHPHAVLAQNDTGAHVAQAVDWVMPTWLLAYWVRQEEELSWEEGIHLLTAGPAASWGGLSGRGVLRAGAPADLNVFDPATISPMVPDADAGLPAGGKRITCGVEGMVATIVNGEVTFRDGEPTGSLPGALLTA